jgi:hypothetical protein
MSDEPQVYAATAFGTSLFDTMHFQGTEKMLCTGLSTPSTRPRMHGMTPCALPLVQKLDGGIHKGES